MAVSSMMSQNANLLNVGMKGDRLSVEGKGITPRPSTPTHDILLPSGAMVQNGISSTSSQRSTLSDEDSASRADDSEVFTTLQGVLSMKKVLEEQIETMRMRLRIEDKHHAEAKDKLAREKDAQILAKEVEIDDLKDSLLNREERIQNLQKASDEKNRIIQSKVGEIEQLKKMVKQAEEYAHKLHRRIGQIKKERKVLEGDALYSEQNTEILRLTEELVQLKKKLSDMEAELQRAVKVIEEQNLKILQLEEERGTMNAQFRAELDKATKAMRQEVERMSAVMRQNYEEMHHMRQQNEQMHNDVKVIKQMLTEGNGSPRHLHGTGIQRPIADSPLQIIKPLDHNSPTLLKGSPRIKTPGLTSVRQSKTRQSLEKLTPTPTPALHGYQPQGPAAHMPQTKASASSSPASNGQAESSAPAGKVFPPICSIKEQPALSNGGLQRGKSNLRLSTSRGINKK